jgi:hypothetical protein
MLIDYSLADWNYLHYHHRIPNADTYIKKDDISTRLFIWRNGTKEVLKRIVRKQTYIMVDTLPLFDHLSKSTCSPNVARCKIAFATQRASALGSFNLFHPLPEASVDRTIYRPCHCGVDFHYDTLKNKLCISLRFRRASPGDATIGSFFGLDPLLVVDPADNNNAPSDASSETTEEDVVDPATIHLVVEI